MASVRFPCDPRSILPKVYNPPFLYPDTEAFSNFLPWQLSYTETYITPKLWPDFTRKDLFEAVEDFGKRNRRYGAVE